MPWWIYIYNLRDIQDSSLSVYDVYMSTKVILLVGAYTVDSKEIPITNPCIITTKSILLLGHKSEPVDKSTCFVR